MDPFVVLAFSIVALLQVALPVVLGYWASKKFGVSWKVFGFGVLFFVVVQVLHVPLVILLQPILTGTLTQMALGQTVMVLVLAIFLGLLAGLFEEPGRWLVFKYFFKRTGIELKKENALMFGIGWGGIESILVGVLVFLTMFSYMVAAPLTDQQMQDVNAAYGGTLTAEQMGAVNAQNEALINLTPLDLVPSLLERIMVITLQIAFTLLVFSAIVSGKKSLLAIAILWHAALDFFAVFVGVTYGILAAEAIIFLFAIIALFYIRKKFTETQSAPIVAS